MNKIHHSDFVAILANLYRPKVYIELGLYTGETWYKTIPYCKESYGVDVINRQIKGNVFIGTTDSFFEKFKHKADMIFIDADHKYESASRDFKNSLDILNTGGVIIMHDTDPIEDRLFDFGYCGDSYKIISDLEAEEGLNILTLPCTEAGLSIITRKGETRTDMRKDATAQH
jgi:hypothetical protein